MMNKGDRRNRLVARAETADALERSFPSAVERAKSLGRVSQRLGQFLQLNRSVECYSILLVSPLIRKDLIHFY